MTFVYSRKKTFCIYHAFQVFRNRLLFKYLFIKKQQNVQNFFFNCKEAFSNSIVNKHNILRVNKWCQLKWVNKKTKKETLLIKGMSPLSSKRLKNMYIIISSCRSKTKTKNPPKLSNMSKLVLVLQLKNEVHLISEWIFDVLNFPKNQPENLINVCHRI